MILRVLILGTLLIGMLAVPLRPALADPELPLPRMPICGDEDDWESPFVFNCPALTPTPDVQTYQVPGSGPIDLRFDFVFREATYDNELAYFVVDTASGAIGSLKVGDAGYLDAALARATIIFPSGSTAYTSDVTVRVNGGDILAFFIIQGGTLSDLRTFNPENDVNLYPLALFSLDRLNPNGGDQFVGFENATDQYTQFGFEDLVYGRDWAYDEDYDDIVYNVLPPLQPLTGQIELSPASASLTTGQQQTFTAKATDKNGVALAGVAVDFTVTGANPTSERTITDSTGTASFSLTGGNAGRDSIVASVLIGSATVVSNTASVDWHNDQPPAVDLAVTSISPPFGGGVICAGDTVPFSASIASNGTAESGSFNVRWVADGQVRDDVLVSISVGGTDTYVYTWQNVASGPHTLTLIADSSDDISESDESNNRRTLTFSVAGEEECGPTARADLKITIDAMIGDASTDSVPEGGALTYVITITNMGPATATGTIMTNTLPQGLLVLLPPTASHGECDQLGAIVKCSIENFVRGSNATYTITGVATGRNSLVSNVTVAANEVDPVLVNNMAESITKVISSPVTAVPFRIEEVLNTIGCLVDVLTLAGGGGGSHRG